MNVIEQKNNLFSAHNIFSSLSPEEIFALAAQLPVVSFEANETIFSIGEKARAMFMVLSGKITIMKMDDYGNSREIAKVIEGDSLAEIDMITGKNYSVTAVAETKTSLLQFPPTNITFPQFLDSNPGPGSKILYAFISDIAERTREANALLKNNSPNIQELRRQIYEDKLTNLCNRTFLEENMPLWLKNKPPPVYLMMIKPDNFKQINDSAGHEAGDKLLLHIARLLPSHLSKDTRLIRYIGNEFAIVLWGLERSEAVKTAELIRLFYNTLDTSNFLPEEGFHLTVSIGIAAFPEHAKDADSLIEQAHKLPLIGRERGGNLILFPEGIAKRYK